MPVSDKVHFSERRDHELASKNFAEMVALATSGLVEGLPWSTLSGKTRKAQKMAEPLLFDNDEAIVVHLEGLFRPTHLPIYRATARFSQTLDEILSFVWSQKYLPWWHPMAHTVQQVEAIDDAHQVLLFRWAPTSWFGYAWERDVCALRYRLPLSADRFPDLGGREAWLVGTMSVLHDDCPPLPASEQVLRAKMQAALLVIQEESGCEVRFVLQTDLNGSLRG
jgi:hypothetical protein